MKHHCWYRCHFYSAQRKGRQYHLLRALTGQALSQVSSILFFTTFHSYVLVQWSRLPHFHPAGEEPAWMVVGAVGITWCGNGGMLVESCWVAATKTELAVLLLSERTIGTSTRTLWHALRLEREVPEPKKLAEPAADDGKVINRRKVQRECNSFCLPWNSWFP